MYHSHFICRDFRMMNIFNRLVNNHYIPADNIKVRLDSLKFDCHLIPFLGGITITGYVITAFIHVLATNI